MALLAVNVDHVATIRQARGGTSPDPVAAAVLVELAGADGVVVHLREDRRHICDRDVRLVRQVVKTKMILEMAATDEMLSIAAEVGPYQATLVPERRQEVTTEGGLALGKVKDQIAGAVERLHAAGVKTSLFLDPVVSHMELAADIGADIVEIHTGRFCDARTRAEKKETFAQIAAAAEAADKLGLTVHAGHGIDYHSIRAFSAAPQVSEFSIGHAIVAKAVMVGLDRAVYEMLALARSVGRQDL
ncbi:MAG: pyridoxine 5'-phosphate synthase [Thermodesulfobacteriota bacterium]